MGTHSRDLACCNSLIMATNESGKQLKAAKKAEIFGQILNELKG
jgi:hypothetical protein